MYVGYARVDSGATETVGFLEAVEAVMTARKKGYGLETVRPNVSFALENGQQKSAVSYVELPQAVNHREVYLGVFTLDVRSVPILLSIKTLKRLGAVIDFEHRRICFRRVDSQMYIPLTESRSGHLLLDLDQ